MVTVTSNRDDLTYYSTSTAKGTSVNKSVNMHRYRSMPDNRPLNAWGDPEGPEYEKKKWESLTPAEMIADFEWKSDLLSTLADEVDFDTFYEDYMFHELYNQEYEYDYKVSMTEYAQNDNEKTRIRAIDVDEIGDYLEQNNVCISPVLYYNNHRKKALMNLVCAFVLDIDKCRPNHLRRFFMLFDEGRLLRPTFVVNSGSGVHFYYVLDKAFQIDTVNNAANRLIAEEIYKQLYNDVIIKEHWREAQRHWLGQDYRIVNSKTKLNLVSQAFKTGEVYSIDELTKHYKITVEKDKRYASPKQVSYAKLIAKNLKIEVPDFTNHQETAFFINQNKDAAYEIRRKNRELFEERQKKLEEKYAKGEKKRKPRKWYNDTMEYAKDKTKAGHRFTTLKALCHIAKLENINEEKFLKDLHELVDYWCQKDWEGDNFNKNNVEAIERYWNNIDKYQASSKTLEEYLGYEFKRIPVRRNDREQKVHLARIRKMQEFDDPEATWRNKEGAPTKKQQVQEWRKNNPGGKKIDCERDTGLSRHTVLKWWNE